MNIDQIVGVSMLAAVAATFGVNVVRGYMRERRLQRAADDQWARREIRASLERADQERRRGH